jgi:hypothetical protein
MLAVEAKSPLSEGGFLLLAPIFGRQEASSPVSGSMVSTGEASSHCSTDKSGRLAGNGHGIPAAQAVVDCFSDWIFHREPAAHFAQRGFKLSGQRR